MLVDTYTHLIERIATSAKLSVDDIGRRIEAKRAKLSGLVSREGAAQIVAAELGINFEKERMKLGELAQGMRRANVIGKVLELFPVRSYNKNGKEGKVANLVIADETSRVRVVLWDANHIALVEQGKINLGDVLEVTNAGVRNGELHLSSFGDIRQSKELIGEITVTVPIGASKLKDATPGQRLQTRAFVVQVFDPRYFEVCPDCGRKVIDEACATHGKIAPKRRALLNLVLDDGTESLRCVLFGEHILKLGFSEEEIFSLELFNGKKSALLGEEKVFAGNVRQNTLYNTVEFIIDSVEEVKFDELIAAFETSKIL